MNNFKVYGLEDIARAAKGGTARIAIRPDGHWSYDTINVRFTRDMDGTDSWSSRIEYSASYDYKSGVSSNDAISNFIEALQFARQLGEVISPEVLEQYYQIGVKEWNNRKKVVA
jgi:hypothetical protein